MELDFTKVLVSDHITMERLQRFLEFNLPVTVRMNQDERIEISQLNDYKAIVFKYLINHYERKKIVADSLIARAIKLNEIRGRILNAGAHAGDEPLYRQELEAALTEIKDFKSDLSKLKYP